MRATWRAGWAALVVLGCGGEGGGRGDADGVSFPHLLVHKPLSNKTHGEPKIALKRRQAAHFLWTALTTGHPEILAQ